TVSSGLIDGFQIVMIVSIGLAIMLVLGLLRIVYQWSLQTKLLLSYGFIFIMSFFTAEEFIAISFDASGATTGAITVPFVLAMAGGIAALERNTKSSSEDSFGLIALASAGAIMVVMVHDIVSPTGELTGSLDIAINTEVSIVSQYITILIQQAIEVFFTLFPIVAIFWLYQKFRPTLSKYQLSRICKGNIYVYIGLTLFMTGVNAGFMNMGTIVGYTLGNEGMYFQLGLIGLIFGVVTIIAEPAVSVQTHQIENVTSGAIRRKPILISLCIGVGL